MKILLTGSNGQIGHAIQSVISQTPFQLLAYNRSTLDITNIFELRKTIEENKPAVIINAAAYTAVDQAETEKETVFNINALGPKNLAQLCETYQIPLLHLSSDYIFDGKNETSYSEDDVACPLNVYGESKWEGEEAIRKHCEKHFILRVSWVFGEAGDNFVKILLRLMKEQEEISVVNDQFSSPTYARDIAKVLLFLTQQNKWGTYHFCGTPVMSKFSFANIIFEEASLLFSVKLKNILAVPADEYQTKAIRPKYAVLNCDKLVDTFGIYPSYWHKGLMNVIREEMACPIG